MPHPDPHTAFVANDPTRTSRRACYWQMEPPERAALLWVGIAAARIKKLAPALFDKFNLADESARYGVALGIVRVDGNAEAADIWHITFAEGAFEGVRDGILGCDQFAHGRMIDTDEAPTRPE